VLAANLTSNRFLLYLAYCSCCQADQQKKEGQEKERVCSVDFLLSPAQLIGVPKKQLPFSAAATTALSSVRHQPARREIPARYSGVTKSSIHHQSSLDHLTTSVPKAFWDQSSFLPLQRWKKLVWLPWNKKHAFHSDLATLSVTSGTETYIRDGTSTIFSAVYAWFPTI